jgi:cysteine desulfurase family protein (TIGR01976 family)
MLDPEPLRAEFPAVSGEATTPDGRPLIFFDNPGGTQVPRRVIDAVADYYRTSNANVGGAFATSWRTDAAVLGARQAMADLLGAPDPATIVFGASMTALTFHLARSIAETIRPGDEVVVTNLDHDANVAPWTDLAANGAVVKVADMDPATGEIDEQSFARALTPGKTRLVAFTHASNALGTVPDVARLNRMAQEAGALTFIDAVQYAPHGPLDVARLGCDFLACSAYKFFGPHVGVLYGKREYLENLKPHKVRPAKDVPPYRWETGTLNHEGLAGVAAAVDYLHGVGERFGAPYADRYAAEGYAEGRRRTLLAGMEAIRVYEKELSARLIAGLREIPGVTVHGPTDPARLDHRVPTVAFTWDRMDPRATCEYLYDRAGVCAWSGNYYAVNVMDRLGLNATGGAVRVGACHYNTPAEIDALLAALRAAPRP